MGNLLEGFKKYCSQRFEIPLADLEDKLPLKTGYLFPSFVKEDGEPNDTKIRAIVKPALIEAGIQYKDFPPLHIWRHTFAQEALLATNYNYELVASIGGWVNTRILKGHYGQMGGNSKGKGVDEDDGPEFREYRLSLDRHIEFSDNTCPYTFR